MISLEYIGIISIISYHDNEQVVFCDVLPAISRARRFSDVSPTMSWDKAPAVGIKE